MMDPELRQAISKAHLESLARLLRQLAEHCATSHNCQDTAESLQTIADRLDTMHAGVMKIREIAARRSEKN